MNITITFRPMDGSDAVKHHISSKLAKLQKFLRAAMNAQATVSVDGLVHTVEVSISSGGARYHATERSQDMHASIDLVLDKLERQIHSEKDSQVSRKRGGMTAAEFATRGGDE